MRQLSLSLKVLVKPQVLAPCSLPTFTGFCLGAWRWEVAQRWKQGSWHPQERKSSPWEERWANSCSFLHTQGTNVVPAGDTVLLAPHTHILLEKGWMHKIFTQQGPVKQALLQHLQLSGWSFQTTCTFSLQMGNQNCN